MSRRRASFTIRNGVLREHVIRYHLQDLPVDVERAGARDLRVYGADEQALYDALAILGHPVGSWLVDDWGF